ncbi:MAG: hypothetical protein QXR84_06020 [Candidatus Bathyarchaeia archaeon]
MYSTSELEPLCLFAFFIQTLVSTIILIYGIISNSIFLIIIGLLGLFFSMYRTRKLLHYLEEGYINSAYEVSLDPVNVALGFFCGVIPGVLLLYINYKLRKIKVSLRFIELHPMQTGIVRNRIENKIEIREIIDSEGKSEKHSETIVKGFENENSKWKTLYKCEKIEEYLERLELLHRENKVSQEVYEKLKKEYESRLNKLRENIMVSD